MKIAKIYIENFRSIKGPLALDLSQINAIVGQNNAGKTNILLALKKVLGSAWLSVNTFSEDDVYMRDYDADIKIRLDIDPPIPYAKLKDTEPALIKTLEFVYTRYKIGEQKGLRRLDKTCYGPDGKSPMILAKRPQKGERNKYEPVIGIPSEILDSIPVVFIGADRGLRGQLPGARYSLLRQLLEDIDKDFKNPENLIKEVLDGKEVEKTRVEKFTELMKEAVKLLHTDDFESLEQTIKRNTLLQLGLNPEDDAENLDFFFSPFSSMDFYKSLRLFIREGEFKIDATELGGGVQNALIVSIFKAFEERKKQGAVFLIEEPEMYLHPQRQRSFYKTLRDIGEGNQVIYTTHSPHFVTIPEYDEVVIVKKSDEGTYCKRTNLYLDSDQREKIKKELDTERNELFFAKKVLLVEGDTEKLSFPEFALKLGYDLDVKGISIVEVGGKRSLMGFAQIAISFGIPTAVIYDEDSSDFTKDEDEEAYNKDLDNLQRGNDVKVWKFSRKYEDELRKHLGEELYQKLCQKYPKYSNAIRQKLIASDVEVGIPPFVKEIIEWAMQNGRKI